MLDVDRVDTAQIDEATIQSLADRFQGTLVRPMDTDYDADRQVWNGMIDRYPALIARCAETADVIAAVNFARENNLLIAVRGGGHNVAGNAVCDGGVVIDLSLMRAVEVDAGTHTVRAQGGATWADVDRKTEPFGLAVPGGMVSTTGVAGLTLHGGMGHLRRKYGLSIDNLISVEIVTADGQVRTASRSENSDLFWAIRGAGSNFGVITSFEFRAHPIGPAVMLCAPIYALEDAQVVLPKWQEFMATAPREVSSMALFWSVPADPHFPGDLHSRPIVVVAAVYSGPADEGEKLLQPLRELATPVLDLSAKESYIELQTGFDPFFPEGMLCYWKSHYVDEPDDALFAELARRASERPSPLSMVEIWHLGGAIQEAGAGETAFSQRGAPYMLSFSATWTDPDTSEANVDWARNGWAAIHQLSSGHGAYLNFPGFGEEQDAMVRAAYGENYERLVELKTLYDPANLFRFNQNIRPASAGSEVRA
ncbi:FAD-binding oxidoreductase [soil metagenome]